MEARQWLVPDCYWPTPGPKGAYESHESICVLNVGDVDAEITIDFYFEDREPILAAKSSCAARRTHHIRLDKLILPGGGLLPRGVPYAARLTSSVPISVQYSRCDVTQPHLTLMTSMAHPI